MQPEAVKIPSRRDVGERIFDARAGCGIAVHGHFETASAAEIVNRGDTGAGLHRDGTGGIGVYDIIHDRVAAGDIDDST